MKLDKLFLFLSLLGIFILLFLSNFTKPIAEGKVTEMKFTKHTSIKIETTNETIIAMNENIDLKKDSEIKIYGNIEGDAIFATKIVCTKRC